MRPYREAGWLEVRARVPRGPLVRGGVCVSRPAVFLPPFAPGSLSPWGTADCSHAETTVLVSKVTSTTSLPAKANSQHMRPSLSPLLPPRPTAEGEFFHTV